MSYATSRNSLPILAIWGDRVITPLPHQTALIEAARKNVQRQARFLAEIEKRIKYMDFREAIDVAKEGGKVRRSIWPDGMWMSWFTNNNTGFLVHTHPYFDHQQAATPWGDFLYVTENDDAFASDWVRTA